MSNQFTGKPFCIENEAKPSGIAVCPEKVSQQKPLVFKVLTV
jgi:hypothetical protein